MWREGEGQRANSARKSLRARNTAMFGNTGHCTWQHAGRPGNLDAEVTAPDQDRGTIEARANGNGRSGQPDAAVSALRSNSIRRSK